IGTAGLDENDSCFIGNIWNQTASGGTWFYIKAVGKLGTSVSFRRFKEKIKPMGKASGGRLALKTVIFPYKTETKKTPCFGLIAEDVAEVNPDLVVRDKEGKPYTVRYDQVNVMLLNEFLKEHKNVEEQETSITQLKSAVARQESRIAKQEKNFALREA